jgi:ABC-2 type transport system ATP-binding protein
VTAAGPAAAPVIAAERLSKWYGDVSGLNDVTVTILPGITGLLGPNGAGKSTFMKLVTGQLTPSTGVVRVLGQPIWGNPAVFARIGFCPDHDAFYERMTGRRGLAALVRLNGLNASDARRAALRALELVELVEAADRRIGGYSKGMRQRIKLAQAIVHDPELLILDEPLNGMDPLMRRTTIRLIKDWARAGKSVLVSSHILREIEAMTSTILLVNNGRIVAEGNVHQIRELIDEHPHKVCVRAADPRRLAQHVMSSDEVVSVTLEEGAVVIETAKPDAFYARLTALAASGDAGDIDEITSPDDNLHAVFTYLVKP